MQRQMTPQISIVNNASFYKYFNVFCSLGEMFGNLYCLSLTKCASTAEGIFLRSFLGQFYSITKTTSFHCTVALSCRG